MDKIGDNMFRRMRRFNQALSDEECKSILKTEKRATLAVNGDDGYPYALPVDFYYDEEDNKIYIHSAKAGYKLECIERSDKVCIMTHNKGEQKEDWSYHVKSVILFGRANLMEDTQEKRIKAKAFGVKYYPSEEEVEVELNKDYNRMNLIEITIEHMSGKRVHER